ncbi:MAG: T9SS type A sorting domain-containing protein [Bacteroidota bacterium]|nr:T9SS type A sorting domain-containing protein [Bacteroidota bacterium]
MKKLYHRCLILPLALLLGLLPLKPAAAQVLWTRLVATPSYHETGEFMTAVAGGFVLVGRSSYPQPQGLYLSKVNYRGDTLWTRRMRFPKGNGVYARGVLEDRAGNLVVSATLFDSNVVPSLFWGGLAKLTATGDTLWTRLTGDGINTLVLGNDGSYVLASDLRLQPTQTLPTLLKYSPAGALVWSSALPYDNTNAGTLTEVVAVSSGYLVQSMPHATGFRPKLMRVSEAGSYQSARLTNPYGLGKLRLDSDGNLLATGAGLTKLTPVGDTIWSRTYPQGGNSYQGLAQVVELPNGQYLAAGSSYNGDDYDLSLYLTDHNGVLLRDTLLVRQHANESVAGVGLTPAGDYVVGGSADTYLAGNSTFDYAQLWLSCRSWARLLPTRAGQAEPQNRLFAFPNPTTDEVRLTAADGHALLGSWTLLDLLGRPVQAGRLPGLGAGALRLGGQPAGVYLLRVTDERRASVQTLRLEKH